MQARTFAALTGALAVGTIMACAAASATAATTDTTGTTGTTGLPAVFSKFTNGVKVSLDGDYVVLTSNGEPDHKSVYFAKSDPRYEPYNGTNASFMANQFQIMPQQLTFRIPLHPAQSSNHPATPLGPIGIALNGVPIFNQYNGQNRPLTVEINSFDQYNGHPQMTGQYHYHVEPIALTEKNGSSSLIGFLLDGYPVYGPVENGKRLTDVDLDELHGHFGPTADYPSGIYHYHVTAEDPYINGAGFYGVPGTVGR
ncbi:MAG TPA: YHYH protein [Gemmatimonadaceae bacterium]|nr:YHYH protein [Gemmatimonadaceae bacterium]